jgi:hypothetical protein
MKAMATWKERGPSKYANPNQFDTLKGDKDNEETESSNGNDDSESSNGNDDSESSNGKDETESNNGKDETESNNENDDNNNDESNNEKETKSDQREKVKPMKSSTREIKNLLPSKGFQSNQSNSSKSSTKTKVTQRDQGEKVRPMKSLTREIKNLLPSKGFQSNQSNSSKRKTSSREKYEPNFEPTYKRKDPTFMIENEEDDLTDMNPVDQSFGQLLSCLEQNIGKESGKLDNQQEDLIKSLQSIGNPDPKSQKTIDRMPEHERKRYNDATTKEYEGMKAKDVMEFVRMTDIPKNTKIYICIVNWVTKYVLGVY